MNLIVELIKYLMILLMGIYTYYSFSVFRYKNRKQQDRAYTVLTVIIFMVHFIGYATLLLQIQSLKLIILYGGEVLLFILVLALYRMLYPKLSKLLLRNMLMLLAISFIVLTRLSYTDAVRQVVIVGVSFLVSLFVPHIIKGFHFLNRFGMIYGLSGIVILLVVLVAGRTSFGATNWLEIGGVSIQPSEIVKLLFVLFVAAMFQIRTNFKRICVVSALAAANVLILVLQKDLGGALIFFVTYIFMLYAATAKPLYLFSGLMGGSAASYIAYKLFNHVRVRVMAWQNPMKYIDKEGFQISQSLFAIGTGGWFGMGINRGLPTSIPVVESDFIFSAISEELGGLFAICIILIYASCFVMFINIALNQEHNFYRLMSIGFSVMFAFQVILSIGGVIKFIPSTGVTLPLVSQGGSSVLMTIVMFMMLQGVYILGKSQRKDAEISVTEEMEELQ
jgi:cell division protein FtsW (lipid II flippase)